MNVRAFNALARWRLRNVHRDGHPLFDAAYYLAANPDVAVAGADPYRHFLSHGRQEGRQPNAAFDVAFYERQVGHALVDPLDHYWRIGAARELDPHPDFSTHWYMTANPDVRSSGTNPLLHYIKHGRAEGRDAQPGFVRDLLRGLPWAELTPPRDTPVRMSIAALAPDDVAAGPNDRQLVGFGLMMSLSPRQREGLLSALAMRDLASGPGFSLSLAADRAPQWPANVLLVARHGRLSVAREAAKLVVLELHCLDVAQDGARFLTSAGPCRLTITPPGVLTSPTGLKS
jgi:hypothetical protein